MNYAEQTNVSLNNYKQVAVIREEQLFVSKCSLGYKLQITIYINFIVYDYLRFMFVLIRIKWQVNSFGGDILKLSIFEDGVV